MDQHMNKNSPANSSHTLRSTSGDSINRRAANPIIIRTQAEPVSPVGRKRNQHHVEFHEQPNNRRSSLFYQAIRRLSTTNNRRDTALVQLANLHAANYLHAPTERDTAQVQVMCSERTGTSHSIASGALSPVDERRSSDMLRLLFRAKSPSLDTQAANCKRLQAPRLSLLGKPIMYKAPRVRPPAYRFLQMRAYNFLERPRGSLALFYHLAV